MSRKRRHIRRRQWERYVTRLSKLGPNYLCPPGAMREYNRQAARHNRRQNTYRAVELSTEDGSWW